MSEQTELGIKVLNLAKAQLMREIAQCGSAGGVGRAQNYAPILVSISEALRVFKDAAQEEEEAVEKERANYDRMADVRAAKTAKQSD